MRWQQICGDCPDDCRILSEKESAEVTKLIESKEGIHVCQKCGEFIHYFEVDEEGGKDETI